MESSPDAPAVLHPVDLTYVELFTAARELAWRLSKQGVGQGDLAVLWTRCSLESLIGSIATWLVGGAFVPLDERTPPERVLHILRDCKARVLISDAVRVGQVGNEFQGARLTVETAGLPFPLETNTLRTPDILPSDVAYVIYTSGSTGKPKGVAVTHGNLANFVRARVDLYGRAPRMMPIHPVSFDPAQGAMAWSLATGGSLVPLTMEELLDASHLASVIEDSDVTHLSASPSVYAGVMSAANPEQLNCLETAMVGGESLSRTVAIQHHETVPHARLVNEYGPTEATIVATAYDVPAVPPDPIPIGRSVTNVSCLVFRPDGELAETGESGELYIGGAGVAAGYIGQPERTRERFVPHPQSPNGPKLYRTGDRVRLNEDGHLEFLGRIDFQIKLRGNRIEPGEIENALVDATAANEAVVLLRTLGDAGPALVAFYSADDPGELVDPRLALGQSLPPHMIPSLFVHVSAFPLTASGKIDRKSLDEWPLWPEERNAASNPPITDVERTLANIWADVLQLQTDSIFRDDDFFALGGHSLLLAEVHQRIQKQLSTTCPMATLFSSTQLHDLAATLELQTVTGATPHDTAIPLLSYPLAPIQETFYYLSQLDTQSAAYVVAATIRITGPLDTSRFRRSAQRLLDQLPLLNSRVSEQNETPSIVFEKAGSIDWLDAEAVQPKAIEHAIAEFAQKPIDIGARPLIRFQLLTAGAQEYFFSVAAHHIAFDGISVRLFFDALWSEYEGNPDDARVPYGEFALHTRRELQGPCLQELYDFWRTKLADPPAPTTVPYSYAPNNKNAHRVDGRVAWSISSELTENVRALSREQRATPFMTTLATLYAILGRYTGHDDLVVGAPVSVRGVGNFSKTIGCMINTTVLRTRVPGRKATFQELLAETRQTVVSAIAHCELPFTWLTGDVKPPRVAGSRTPFFSVFFNYIDRTDMHRNVGDLRIEPVHDQHPIAKFDLTVYVHDWGDRLEIEMVYDGSRYDNDSIETFALQFESMLEQVTSNPERPVIDYALPAVATESPAREPGRAFGRIQDAFLEQVRLAPHAHAVVYTDATWTYSELAERAANVSMQLRASGLREGDRIAICADRGAALVACVVGALDAGCIFALLDPEHDAHYLESILSTLRPRAVLDPNSIFENSHTDVLLLHGEHLIRPTKEYGLGEANTTGDRGAYAVFTSGTTGAPKGFVSGHAPVVHFLQTQSQAFDFRESDRFTMLSGISHDPIMRDIFAPLSVGASLYIPTSHDRMEPQRLAIWMRAQRITAAHCTPSLCTVMAAGNSGIDSLRCVFLGGERIGIKTVHQLRMLAPHARIVNCYGLSETPQVMAWHEIDAGDAHAAIPIGRALPGIAIRLVNAAGNECGTGELGEFVIETPHLADGMIDGDRVRPFDRTADGTPQICTGDLGRRDSAGDLYFVERKDRQIKIRGYRVEPEAVEAALRALPEILDARVVCREANGDSVLYAFVLASDLSRVDESNVRSRLKSSVLDAALPNRIFALEQFPLTANGKIDDRKLLHLQAARPDAPEETFVSRQEARTQAEEHVMRVWSEVLGHPDISIDDDFFHLGGSSLSGVQIISRLSTELDVPLNIELLMQNTTPLKLVEALQKAQFLPEESLVVRTNVSGTAPPFWMIHPVGGHVLFIRRFAEGVDADQPIYGIQAQGLDGSTKPLTDIPVMASLYIEQIRAVQPHGPYYIGGPSLGGRIAYEMAQQLAEQGEETALLAMFDTWAPGYPKRMRLDKWAMRKVPEYLNRLRAQSLREIVKGLASRGAFGYSHYEAGDQTMPMPGNLSSVIENVVAANEHASRSYAVKPYDGTVTLFRAQQRPDWNGVNFSEPTNGWSRWAKTVNVVEVDCTHQTIMDHPALTTATREFSKHLEAARLHRELTS